MKIGAIICEYNPLHSGHLYHLTETKKICEAVICVLSGDFVQRARPAALDKYYRARLALLAGADMVVELPAPYSFLDAERFCECGVLIADVMGAEILSFGSESGETKLLEKIADIQLREDDFFKEYLKNTMSKGVSYPSAYAEATAQALSNLGLNKAEILNILNKPNNILSIGYIKSIKKHGLNLTPYTIKRRGAEHDGPQDSAAEHQSASTLRTMLKDKSKHDEILPYLFGDNDTLAEYAAHAPDEALYDALALNALRLSSTEELNRLYSADRDISKRIRSAAVTHATLNEALDAAKTKRYTHARLRRIALECLLNVEKHNVLDVLPPLRLLGIRENFKPHLSRVRRHLITQNTDIEQITSSDTRLIDQINIQKKASRLYGQLAGYGFDSFYSRSIVTI